MKTNAFGMCTLFHKKIKKKTKIIYFVVRNN